MIASKKNLKLLDETLNRSSTARRSYLDKNSANKIAELVVEEDLLKLFKSTKIDSIDEAVSVLGCDLFDQNESLDNKNNVLPSFIDSYIEDLLHETIFHQSTLKKAVLFFREGIFPIMNKSFTYRISQSVFEDVIKKTYNSILNNESLFISFYYFLAKFPSPLRTNTSNGHIDLSELEMMKKLNRLVKCAQRMSIDIKIMLVNETNLVADTVSHVDEKVVKSNIAEVKNFLKKSLTEKNFTFRDLQKDLLFSLKSNFNQEYMVSFSKVDETDKTFLTKKNVYLSCIPTHRMYKCGASKQEIKHIFASLLSTNEPYTPQLLEEKNKETVKKFISLMNMRSLIINMKEASLAPQFSQNTILSGITLSKNRVSFTPTRRFRGEIIFPSHGFGVYANGKFRGVISFWHMLLQPSMFKLLRNDSRIFAVELI